MVRTLRRGMVLVTSLQALEFSQTPPSAFIRKESFKNGTRRALVLSLLLVTTCVRPCLSFVYPSIAIIQGQDHGECVLLSSRLKLDALGVIVDPRRRQTITWRLLHGRTPQLRSSYPYRSTTSLPATAFAGGVFPVATTLSHGAPAVRAFSALILSTLIGFGADQWVFSGSGILATLATAAALTNTGLAPSTHILYDWCWSTGLPASLVFLLLSLRQSHPPVDSRINTNDTAPSVLKVARRLALPFLIASFGSVLGCVGSFELCRLLRHLSPDTENGSLGLLLSPKDACWAAACLAASFVGGSVNFFATAVALSGTATTQVGDSGSLALPKSTTNTLVSSMAAADLVVMALYFASLGIMVNSRQLRQWLGEDVGAGQSRPPTAVEAATLGPETVSEDLLTFRCDAPLHRGAAALLVSVLALAVVQVARRVERWLTPIVPGTACAVIAVLVPLLQRGVSSLTETRKVQIGNWMHSVSAVSGPMAKICFFWMFAAVGTTADVASALRNGPACFVFSLASLGIHIGFLLGMGRLFHNRKRQDRADWMTPNLEELLVASNAAIGGPATAATFCGQLPPTCPDKAGLTVAATFYGVLGYAVGTTLGVTLYRILASYAKIY